MLRIHIAPTASAARAIGSTMPKIQRQPRVSSSTPDIVGPMAGASAITMLTRPIIRPRACGGTTFMMVVISSGIMIAVPEACTTRPTSRVGKPGETRAMRVPSENRLIAAMNITRVGKRRRRKPVIGMTTAIVSMNAVVSHCAATAVMPRSVMRWGMATPIVVSLRIATKAAARRSQMTRLPSAETVPVRGRPTVPVPGWTSVAAMGSPMDRSREREGEDARARSRTAPKTAHVTG